LDSGPNWSPEGEFIAFAQVREGSYDVMVQPVAGGEAVVRADGPGDETTPRWSPDGRYLAYVSTSELGSFVYLVPPHGGTPRKLIETGIATLYSDSQIAVGDRPWASDSRTLLVSRVSDSGRMAINRVDRDNGAAEQVSFPPAGTDDHSASYSFDGERIAFVRGGPQGGDLMMMPADGGDPEVLQPDALEPAFRPDGRHLLFLTGRRAGVANLWELDLETGALSQLTSDRHQQVWSFSVSSTNRIAYQGFWHDTFLFLVDVTTGERRQLTSHTKDNYFARFSPKGGTIAYSSSRTGNAEVFLHHLDGSPETQVTNDPGFDTFQDWSPDGRQLLFMSNRQDFQPRLFIANSDGGGTRPLVDQPVSVPSRWSPDGKRIGYLVTADEITSLWTIGPQGDDAKQVIRGVESFDWYRDGRHAIYTRRHGSHSEMIAVNLETGREQSLFVGPLMEMDVAPDGSAVAFCFGRGHMSMGLALLRLEPPEDLQGLPRAVGEPEYVVRTEGTWHVHNGGWSPDSKSLVYTQDQDFGDIYELEERE
jgi:Tol biopolymer transport system component